MTENWIIIEKDIQSHRDELIERLVKFSLTDLLFFWSNEDKLKKLQSEKWGPVLIWLNNKLDTHFQKTYSLEPPKENESMRLKLKHYLTQYSDKQLSALYVAATNMRSVLLATALVEKKINAQKAFELSELESLYQIQKWGKDQDIETKMNALKETLIGVEKYLKS